MRINNLLLNPHCLRQSQEKWNAIIFDNLNGKTSDRIVEAIMKNLENKKYKEK